MSSDHTRYLRMVLARVADQSPADRAEVASVLGEETLVALTAAEPGIVGLEHLAALLALIEERLPDVVDAARREDASWADVAHALGTTKQAAWARFGPQHREARRQRDLTVLAEMVAEFEAFLASQAPVTDVQPDE